MEGIPEVVMVGGLGVYRREGNVKGRAGAGCCLGIVPEFIHRVFLKGMMGVGERERVRERERETERREGEREGETERQREKNNEVEMEAPSHIWLIFCLIFRGLCSFRALITHRLLQVAI